MFIIAAAALPLTVPLIVSVPVMVAGTVGVDELGLLADVDDEVDEQAAAASVITAAPARTGVRLKSGLLSLLRVGLGWPQTGRTPTAGWTWPGSAAARGERWGSRTVP